MANVISLHARACQQMPPEHKLSNHPDVAWKSQILTNICDQDRKKTDFNILFWNFQMDPYDTYTRTPNRVHYWYPEYSKVKYFIVHEGMQIK